MIETAPLAMGVWGQAVTPFLSTAITAQVAAEPWQLQSYYSLRKAIFAEEQKLFQESDWDEHDAEATPIVAVTHLGGMPDDVIGVVRIYPTERGTWFGGRLGVSPNYRSRRVVGTALICAAVSTAHAWGATRFLATIQVQNVRYFGQHHFSTLQHVQVCGKPHHLMQADLSRYPRSAALADKPVHGDAAASICSRARAA